MSTTSEAESYLRLAISSNMFLNPNSQFFRATTEEYSLDSYQNLLFSIARFHEYTGQYPQKITVVGFEMKRRRFAELHRAAIRWPTSRFDYIGIDSVSDEHSQAQEGEVSSLSLLLSSISHPGFLEIEWLYPIHSRHVRMPFCPSLQAKATQPHYAFPSILHIFTRPTRTA
jgi:hypothetical protein